MRQVRSKRFYWSVGLLLPGLLLMARSGRLRLAAARIGLEISGAAAAALNTTSK